MKKILLLSMLLMIGTLCISMSSEAGLILTGQGTSTHGTYNLIYDDDRNITWYDFSNGRANWDDQTAWVTGLTVNFNSNSLGGWRLPTTVDGLNVWGDDGTTTAGYNITTSEMGHLFYTELHNLGSNDTFGVYVGDGNFGLNNTGDFQHLLDDSYWSSTLYAADTNNNTAWLFRFSEGDQWPQANKNGNSFYGLAVRDGDVAAAAVPEPATVALLGIGIAGLAGAEVRRRRKKKTIDKS